MRGGDGGREAVDLAQIGHGPQAGEREETSANADIDKETRPGCAIAEDLHKRAPPWHRRERGPDDERLVTALLGPVPDGVLAGQIRLLGLGQDIKPEEDILPFGNRCHGDGVAVDGHVEPRGWGWGVLSRTARSESSFSDDASLGVTSWTRRAI